MILVTPPPGEEEEEEEEDARHLEKEFTPESDSGHSDENSLDFLGTCIRNWSVFNFEKKAKFFYSE